MHLASVAADFSVVAGLHRWFMTYSSGFHRRGLVGTVFQFLVGDLPRAAQIEVASQVSAIGIYLWLIAALGLFLVAAARVKSNAFRWAALAFAAFAFINPMWTTRAFDNGYLDWLVGLAVVGALAAFAYRRPLLSGALVAVSIVAYWGTIFIWLPLGFLIFAHSAKESRSLVRMFAAGRRRELFALLLPLASALFSALLHDNDAALAELTRIGGQENIIRETFSGEWTGLLRQIETLRNGWRTYLAIAAVFALPPMLCAALWTCFMRRCGYSLFQRAWLDIGVAVVATTGAVVVPAGRLRLVPAHGVDLLRILRRCRVLAGRGTSQWSSVRQRQSGRGQWLRWYWRHSSGPALPFIPGWTLGV